MVSLPALQPSQLCSIKGKPSSLPSQGALLIFALLHFANGDIETLVCLSHPERSAASAFAILPCTLCTWSRDNDICICCFHVVLLRHQLAPGSAKNGVTTTAFPSRPQFPHLWGTAHTFSNWKHPKPHVAGSLSIQSI